MRPTYSVRRPRPNEWVLDIAELEYSARMCLADLPHISKVDWLAEIVDLSVPIEIEVERIFYSTGDYYIDPFESSKLSKDASCVWLVDTLKTPTEYATQIVDVLRDRIRYFLACTIGRPQPGFDYGYDIDLENRTLKVYSRGPANARNFTRKEIYN